MLQRWAKYEQATGRIVEVVESDRPPVGDYETGVAVVNLDYKTGDIIEGAAEMWHPSPPPEAEAEAS